MYRSKQGGSFEEALDINVVDVEDLFNPASGYWENPANWNDMDYVWKLKVERLQQEYVAQRSPNKSDDFQRHRNLPPPRMY